MVLCCLLQRVARVYQLARAYLKARAYLTTCAAHLFFVCCAKNIFFVSKFANFFILTKNPRAPCNGALVSWEIDERIITDNWSAIITMATMWRFCFLFFFFYLALWMFLFSFGSFIFLERGGGVIVLLFCRYTNLPWNYGLCIGIQNLITFLFFRMSKLPSIKQCRQKSDKRRYASPLRQHSWACMVSFPRRRRNKNAHLMHPI